MSLSVLIRHTATLFILSIILSGCVSTRRNITDLHGAFYSIDLKTGEKVVNSGKTAEFETHFRQAVPNPEKTNLIIYLHGTDGSGVGQKCEPVKYAPALIKEMISSIPNTVSYYQCVNVISGGNSGKSIQLSDAYMRSEEIANLLERFHSLGIDYRRIFLIGNSGGASTSLYVALNHPERIGGFIASAPGYGYGYIIGDESNIRLRRYYTAWKSALSGIKNANGLVYAYKEDKYSPPKQMAFLADIEGIELLYIAKPFCNKWPPHAYMFTRCFIEKEQDTVVNFINQRLEVAGLMNTETINTAVIPDKIRNLSNKNVCAQAIQLKNKQIVWDTRKNLWDKVSEAKRREFTPHTCMNILGWESST